VGAAHVAEVTCRTGLGDVGAQALGGLVIGVQPGAPPHGRWRRITVPRGLKVVCATLGPLSTRKLLRDEDFKRRASELGGRAIEKLMKEPTLERFILVSRDFAEELGLLDEELRALIACATKAGAIGASQVMLGRAVFALVDAERSEKVKRAFLELLEPDAVRVANLDLSGARLL